MKQSDNTSIESKSVFLTKLKHSIVLHQHISKHFLCNIYHAFGPQWSYQCTLFNNIDLLDLSQLTCSEMDHIDDTVSCWLRPQTPERIKERY